MPSPAVLSLLALLLAIVLSCATQLNVGLIAVALALVRKAMRLPRVLITPFPETPIMSP